MKITPRQEWFRDRINECILALSETNRLEDWQQFKLIAYDLACELFYATTEWDKYYREINKN